MGDPVALDTQDLLGRLQNLLAARVKEEAGKIAQLERGSRQKCIEGGAELAVHEARQLWAQHHAKTVAFDVPAHDVFGVAPKMFADGPNAGPGRIGFSIAVASGA